MADICRKCDEEEGRTLFVIGAYGIGKERAFLGTARALGWKIWCDPQKVATMRMLQLGDSSMSLLTEVASPFRPAPALVPLTYISASQRHAIICHAVSHRVWVHCVTPVRHSLFCFSQEVRFSLLPRSQSSGIG